MLFTVIWSLLFLLLTGQLSLTENNSGSTTREIMSCVPMSSAKSITQKNNKNATDSSVASDPAKKHWLENKSYTND